MEIDSNHIIWKIVHHFGRSELALREFQYPRCINNLCDLVSLLIKQALAIVFLMAVAAAVTAFLSGPFIVFLPVLFGATLEFFNPKLVEFAVAGLMFYGVGAIYAFGHFYNEWKERRWYRHSQTAKPDGMIAQAWDVTTQYIKARADKICIRLEWKDQ